MKSVILASGSPRRKKLLEQINIPFRVHVSSVDENYDPKLSPEEIVQLLAHRKAEDVAQAYQDALVIGADTIVVFKNEILEKPNSKEEARTMLLKLNGSTHSVFTGIALCKTTPNRETEYHTFSEETRVTFGNIHSDDIEHYVANGSPMDKAGAYGIQDNFGALFVEGIEGEYNTVVGFPLHAFYRELKEFAPSYATKLMRQ